MSYVLKPKSSGISLLNASASLFIFSKASLSISGLNLITCSNSLVLVLLNKPLSCSLFKSLYNLSVRLLLLSTDLVLLLLVMSSTSSDKPDISLLLSTFLALFKFFNLVSASK